MLQYHRREAKPGWWRRFAWLDAQTTQLVDDSATLGGLRRTATPPFKAAPRKRRLTYEYECELQESPVAPRDRPVTAL